MNVFELLFFVSIILAGYFCGRFLNSYWGLSGWIVGFISGSLSAVLTLFGLNKFGDALTKRFPPKPNCKTGRCSSNDYKIIGLSNEKDGIIFQCKCGTRYLKKGKRFMEICDDGNMVPYMRSKGIWGSWENDKEN